MGLHVWLMTSKQTEPDLQTNQTPISSVPHGAHHDRCGASLVHGCLSGHAHTVDWHCDPLQLLLPLHAHKLPCLSALTPRQPASRHSRQRSLSAQSRDVWLCHSAACWMSCCFASAIQFAPSTCARQLQQLLMTGGSTKGLCLPWPMHQFDSRLDGRFCSQSLLRATCKGRPLVAQHAASIHHRHMGLHNKATCRAPKMSGLPLQTNHALRQHGDCDHAPVQAGQLRNSALQQTYCLWALQTLRRTR